jgi:uncharacterized protein
MDEEIDAGEFGEWLAQTQAMLRGTAGAQVPCGSCVGCCVSSYPIPVRPEDRAARERIPASYVRHAPGQPPGHMMMSYREDGTCPMLVDRRCTIYVERPQTCRDYDCRIFAAAGIDVGSGKPVISTRIAAWRFRYAQDSSREAQAAIAAAAAFIRDHPSAFAPHRAPTAPTGVAVLALKSHVVFLDPRTVERSAAGVAQAIVAASRDFDAATDGAG